ncbi:MAG TPA: hypothetical protein VHO25_08545, partial [Polyangiaceae bacterium]|nr:hypothetical protein [Polyangiaceae bacterium]
MFNAIRHRGVGWSAMLAAVLATGSLSSIASAQEKTGTAPASKETAKAPAKKEAAPEAAPQASAEGAAKSAASAATPEAAPAAAPTPPTTAESAAAPAPTTEAAAPLSPFRAVAEKAAALPTPPPSKHRSLFELSQQEGPSSSGRRAPLPKDEPAQPPATLDNLGNFQDHWQLFAHFRGSWVSDPNLDPFADNDFLPALGAGGGRVLYSQGQLSFAALAFVEASGTEAQVRGATSNLDTVRFAVGPELRYHFIPRSYLFARVFPELIRAETTLEDPVSASTLEDHQFAFAADLGAGIAFNAAGRADGEGHQPRLWIV